MKLHPKKVALVIADWPAYEKYCPHFSGMQDGLRELDIGFKVFSCRPNVDIQAIIDYQADMIVYGLLDMVRCSKGRAQIRKSCPNAKIVMWYGDLRNEETGQIPADMSEIDMMFVSNNAQKEFYKRVWQVKDCKFLPLGCSRYEPQADGKFRFPFVFVGAKSTGKWQGHRAMDIMRLEKEGLKVINGAEPELREQIMKRISEIYYSSKVVLDISHFTDIDGYTSNRFWVIPASCGFALTKRFPGCEKFYPEGTRVYFDTIDECIEKMHYYLSHEKERDAIRVAGYEHAKNHTYDKRWLEMFRLLSE